MGLRVFLDSQELELGDDLPAKIQDAMIAASLHVAIFSQNYAQSPWCLAELSFMLKIGAKIIPVFYYVAPSDLRYVEKGVYADAFVRHEENGRYNYRKLEEWKEDLRRVSLLRGWELNERNQDQGMLLKSIVSDVLKEVTKVPLEVAKHPVGLNELVQDFENRMLHCNRESDNSTIVGIVGMGGSGHINCRIDNVSEGKEILRKILRSVRVFGILDDIDHEDQIDALLVKEVLGSDSLVIITSRDKGVLLRSGIMLVYELKGLDPKPAKELFCGHAFLQPHPTKDFEALVEGFLYPCGGLSLSLKVFGGQLYGNDDKVYWKCQLENIKKILPTDIKQRLKVSFDALDGQEKQIFLDIACFFLGEDRDMAIRIWDGSGWSGLVGLQTLVHKCLVEVDDRNQLKMHDHLRDLGRDIADQESPTQVRGIMAVKTEPTNTHWRYHSSGAFNQSGPSLDTPGALDQPGPSYLELPKKYANFKGLNLDSCVGLKLLVINKN
eukprot:Gb_02462 [translate_table: standard]